MNRGNGTAMNSAPSQELPARSVPKTTNDKRRQQVACLLGRALSAATQRNVNVVAEPGGKRDMPTMPELIDALRELRVSEIPHQRDVEQASRTDGDV